MKEFVLKVIAVQASLKAPKGQENKFGKYRYRSCEDILEAVKPLLSDLGLMLLISDEVVLIGDRYYIKASASLTDGDNVHEVAAFARESQDKKGMDTSQITGAASSYARKYALNGLFLIDDTKDADSQDNSAQKETSVKPVKQKPKKSPETYVIEEIKERNVKLDAQQERLIAELILELPKEERKPWMSMIKTWSEGGAELLAELNSLVKLEPSARRNRLRDFTENTLNF